MIEAWPASEREARGPGRRCTRSWLSAAIVVLLTASSLLSSSCSSEPAAECESNNDCGPNQICLEEACRRVCNSNQDCLRNERCHEFICEPCAGGSCQTGSDGGTDDAASVEAGPLRDAAGLDASIGDRQLQDSLPTDSGALDAAMRDVAAADTVTPDTTAPEAAVLDAGTSPWRDPALPCRVEIQLEDSALSTPLYDFTLMVPVPRDLACSGALLEPPNLRIFDYAGSLLSYEVEQSAVNQPHVLWVHLPQIDPGAGTDSIFLYFGAAIGGSPAPLQWPAPYRGIWHLDGDLTDSVAHDSSGLALHANAVGGMGPDNREAGMVGYALRFSASAERLVIGDPADDSLDFSAYESFTYSLWVLADTSVGNSDTPWFKGGSSFSDPGYQLRLGFNAWGAALSDGSSAPWAFFGDEGNMLGRWVFLAAVVDRSASELRTYVDGVVVDGQYLDNFYDVSSTRSATIGADNFGGDPFNGLIDEVRVEAVARADDWILAQFLSVSGSLALLGPVEVRP